MRWERILCITAVLMMMSILLSTSTGAQNGDQPGASDVVYQDASAAAARDNALIAEPAGLSVASVERAIAFQTAFTALDDELVARMPDQISAVWVDPVPASRGYIRFVGDVPEEVRADIAARGLDVVLTGQAEVSMAEHFRRAELAAEGLLGAGYGDFVTFFDLDREVIQVELMLPASAVPPSLAAIVAVVQAAISADEAPSGEVSLRGRAAEIRLSDVALAVITGEGPIVVPEHSRGGNWLLDDGFAECTSGWAVSGPSGDGIITAGHCGGLNQFQEPGVPIYGMTWRNQHMGSGGDVEYHTTDHIHLAEFYSELGVIRDVYATRSTFTMVGNDVCFFGRSSANRTCNHVAEAVDVNFFSSELGIQLGNMARASNASSQGGDSGGGWSLYNTAWGVHHGRDGNGKAYFTPVFESQQAIGVNILLK